MDFYKEIEKNGNLDVLRKVQYVTPSFYNWDGVNQFLFDIVESNRDPDRISKRVFVYGDYDVDGAMSAKIILDGLASVGVTEIDVFRYKHRTHLLDKLAAQECLLGRYDYFIVCDTGSNDLKLLGKIASVGTKIIMLDHHVASFTYDSIDDDSVALINTELENKLLSVDQEEFRLSAGALCYVVLRKFFEEHGYKWDTSIAAYAAISLFADCMDMSSILNRAIYYEARVLEKAELPRIVAAFMNEYSVFCARYVGFWFAPRLNAMFRSEQFDFLNMFLFDKLSPVDLQYCCEKIEDVYVGNREMVKEIADIIAAEELNNFVISDLYSVNRYYDVKENKLANYTGLVANKLSESYGKTAVVYCMNGASFKGSVRDPFGRNYLVLFQQICYAAGHPPAFGLEIKPFDFDNFLANIRRIDAHFSIDTVLNKPIIVTVNSQMPDSVLIEDMALYNEFAGQYMPIVYIRKQIIGDMREVRTKYNYRYSWGEYFIQSDYSLNFGTYVLLKPTKGLSTRLIVQ